MWPKIFEFLAVASVVTERASATSTCGVPNTLTQEEKDLFVNRHNELRASLKATSMWKVRWNEDDARLAQALADTCPNGHSMLTACDGFGVGQNIYYSGDPATTIRGAVSVWFGEKRAYDHENNKCRPGKTCGHYIMTAWSTVYSVGCARTKCSDGTYYVCNYRPSLYSGVRPYNAGTPCTACGDDVKGSGFKCVDGSLCDKCTPAEDQTCQCKSPPDECKHGQWNPSTCKCDCEKSWYGYQCEKSCVCRDDEKYRPDCEDDPELCDWDPRFQPFCPKTCNKCDEFWPTPPPGECQ